MNQATGQISRMADGKVPTSKTFNALIDHFNGGGHGGFAGNGNAGDETPRQMFLAKVTSDALGGGKYNGKLIDIADMTIDEDADLVEGDFGSLASTENCLLYNMEEVGAATHVLTANGDTPLALCFLLNVTSDNRYVAAVLSILSENCTDTTGGGDSPEAPPLGFLGPDGDLSLLFLG